jgi:hypothetical protein
MVKVIENGIGDQAQCFAVWEVTDILQHDAAITTGEKLYSHQRQCSSMSNPSARNPLINVRGRKHRQRLTF